MALVHLRGMEQPVVVDYKDQAPSHATLDNARISRTGAWLRRTGRRQHPGVVAGLDLLYRRYASGKVRWAISSLPAIALAEEGFVLDAALPTSLAESRGLLAKHARRGGSTCPAIGAAARRPLREPRLRGHAARGRRGGRGHVLPGRVARRIAHDLAANGGIMTLEDLPSTARSSARRSPAGSARTPSFAAPPPVATGAALIETLQILDGYAARPGARYAEDADYLHHLIEAWKVRDANRRIADLRSGPSTWASTCRPPRQPALPHDRSPPCRRYGTERDERDDAEDDSGQRIGRGTTAFVVADVSGDMIAVTQTLSTWAGTPTCRRAWASSTTTTCAATGPRAARTATCSRCCGRRRRARPCWSSATMGPPLAPAGLGAAGNAWNPASVYGVISGVIDGGLGASAPSRRRGSW